MPIAAHRTERSPDLWETGELRAAAAEIVGAGGDADNNVSMSIAIRRSASISVVASLAMVLVGCSSSAEVGEKLIEGEIADQIDLGELDASCEEPDKLETGDTFTCTAITEDERTIEFLGTMAEDDINVVTTNLLTVDDITKIRAIGAEVLSKEVGEKIVADDIDCGDESVILDADGDFECEITDPVRGAVYGLIISTGGLDPAAGPTDLYFEVTDQRD